MTCLAIRIALFLLALDKQSLQLPLHEALIMAKSSFKLI